MTAATGGHRRYQGGFTAFTRHDGNGACRVVTARDDHAKAAGRRDAAQQGRNLDPAGKPGDHASWRTDATDLIASAIAATLCALRMAASVDGSRNDRLMRANALR